MLSVKTSPFLGREAKATTPTRECQKYNIFRVLQVTVIKSELLKNPKKYGEEGERNLKRL